MERLGRLPVVGDCVEIPLPDDSARWKDEPVKVLTATVRSIERRVPAEVLVSIRTLESDDE
jgi:hypothetical protein